MKNEKAVALVTVFLILQLLALCYMGYILTSTKLILEEYKLLIECITIAGFGGVLYCLRGVYLNYCVKKQWTNEWIVSYFIRPIVSLICGGVAYLFLKAGLLILDAKKEIDSANLGFLAFAFIAGMNVDKFIWKIEDLAKATWGIEKSRTNNNND